MPTTHHSVMFPTAPICHITQEAWREQPREWQKWELNITWSFPTSDSQGKIEMAELFTERESVKWAKQGKRKGESRGMCTWGSMWCGALHAPHLRALPLMGTIKSLNYIAAISGNLNSVPRQVADTSEKHRRPKYDESKQMSDRYKLVMLFSAA